MFYIKIVVYPIGWHQCRTYRSCFEQVISVESEKDNLELWEWIDYEFRFWRHLIEDKKKFFIYAFIFICSIVMTVHVLPLKMYYFRNEVSIFSLESYFFIQINFFSKTASQKTKY